MLFKQLKYDLPYCRRAFLLLGAFLLLVPVVMRIWLLATGLNHDERLMILFIISGGLIVGVVIVQMHRFFYNGLFGNFGYLALTLPISRGRLMLSKLLTVGIWIHFIGAIATVVLLAYAGIEVLSSIGVFYMTTIILSVYVHSLFVAFFVVSVFFLSTVMALSTFGKFYIPGLVNVISMGALVAGYIAAVARLTVRQFETVTITRSVDAYDGYSIVGHSFYYVIHSEHGTRFLPRYITVNRPITGFSAGRLPLFITHIDLYIVALSLGLGVLALFVAYYLLKKHISLL